MHATLRTPRFTATLQTDGPLLGNGDMGAALGGVVDGGLSFYIGKMDFWTQTSGPTARPDSRHLPTHVAPGHVNLAWGAATPADRAPHAFTAAQDLARARVNATIGYSTATLSLTAFIANDNVLIAEITSDKGVDVNVTLATANMWDLPVSLSTHGTTTMTMERHANSWLNNAAVLTECDADMLLTTGLRGITLEASTQRVAFVNASSGGSICPTVEAHPIYGPTAIVAVPCGPANGSTDWRWHAQDGSLRSSNSTLCVAYPTGDAAAQSLMALPCTSIPSGWATRWRVVSVDALPEGGSQMLKAVDMNNGTSCCGSSSGCKCNRGAPCSAGSGCCDWVDDGGCWSMSPPYLNITLAMAVTITDSNGAPLPSVASAVISPLSWTRSVHLEGGKTYTLRIATATTRPPSFGPVSAVAAAAALAETAALAPLATAHAAWWASWWNASAIDLGPTRQILEGFYYGAQYMLACFARPGGTTAGLLGPWSLQDPVGWSDHLTLDVCKQVGVQTGLFAVGGRGCVPVC